MSEKREDARDQSLREAKECGEVIVVRGSVAGRYAPTPGWVDVDQPFDLDIVILRSDATDPYLDACERAFAGSGLGQAKVGHVPTGVDDE